ncbi:hypothetical protein AO372_1223 [Moraxella catarrhalis]|uniref:hypothetical protein n=1 Tax=Moraxella catarrhalis TaxID=480 RepID=UPI0007E3A21C|nr:hypothetical protein [Moraxella catarrhalis]OAV21309.1 hypothetical protein AO372_1223 [Moraxella catarrhalis]
MIEISSKLKQEMYHDAKNLWFSALFENIPASLPNITFEEQKALFFMLTKEALDADLIKFIPPNDIWYEGYDIWDVSSDEIVAYLRDNFPKDATDGLDSCVNNYFYDIAPAALWRQDDGSYYGS